MAKRTPLYDQHLAAGAKMVDFAGWDMPINYGSQIEEHHQVRNKCGVFDVSHMAVVDLHGERSQELLQHLLANDVARLQIQGKALYSCMLNEQGGVIDDLIVYYMRPDWYRMVVNAGTRDKDLAWIRQHAAAFSVDVNERVDLAMLAVQGAEARGKAAGLLPKAFVDSALQIKRFHAAEHGDWFVGRTGYTGEDGFEIILPAVEVTTFWDKLLAAGVVPVGLGARDTLRLEAGMNLYGADMDETVSPLESGLNWTVAWEPQERDFIGRKAIEQQRTQGGLSRFVGLVLNGRGVLRNHMKVILADGTEGEITSGGFSPTLNRAIALARVPESIGDSCHVEIRNKPVVATVVKPPFVRDGSCQIDLPE